VLEGSFWWKAQPKLVDTYKSMTRCNLGDGKSALFWTDLWQDRCLHKKFQHLYSFAKNKDIFVQEAVNFEYMEDMFHLPLSQQAYEEFQIVENICESTIQTFQEGNQFLYMG
jgi:hypothetical protein